MPLIVDHEAVKLNILMAFQECITEKPLMNITLRDIANKAGMPHSKLLYYFENKKDLIKSYVKYTRDYMSDRCVEWFWDNPRDNYDSNFGYLNAFMEYVATGRVGENRPNATTQTYVLARYDPEIAALVQQEFWDWKTTMEECLKAIYNDDSWANEAEAMMIVISGTFICNYNNALSGKINSNILGYIGNLSKA